MPPPVLPPSDLGPGQALDGPPLHRAHVHLARVPPPLEAVGPPLRAPRLPPALLRVPALRGSPGRPRRAVLPLPRVPHRRLPRPRQGRRGPLRRGARVFRRRVSRPARRRLVVLRDARLGGGAGRREDDITPGPRGALFGRCRGRSRPETAHVPQPGRGDTWAETPGGEGEAPRGDAVGGERAPLGGRCPGRRRRSRAEGQKGTRGAGEELRQRICWQPERF